jgi:hypothetical protein
MKTQRRLAEILKVMMSETPLDEISVSSLAAKAGINRKTFYYHFHDVYDLLTLVFLSEKVEKINKTNNPQEVFELIYDYYTKNESFIDATLRSAGKELFVEFIYNNCFTSFMRFILLHQEGKKLILNTRKTIARFYGYAFANSIVYYFSNVKNKTKTNYLKHLNIVEKDFLERAIYNSLKKRDKDGII